MRFNVEKREIRILNKANSDPNTGRSNECNDYHFQNEEAMQFYDTPRNIREAMGVIQVCLYIESHQ